MDLQSNVNELITLRTNGVEDAMKSMKDIESLFDKVICQTWRCPTV